MTHRTVDFGAGPIEVFDTSFAALRWIKNSIGECKVLSRGKFYFQRRAGFEMTIRLNATECPENAHLLSAANAVGDEVERALELPAAPYEFVSAVELGDRITDEKYSDRLSKRLGHA